MSLRHLPLISLVSLLATACVSQGRYDQAVNDAQRADSARRSSDRRVAASEAHAAQLADESRTLALALDQERARCKLVEESGSQTAMTLEETRARLEEVQRAELLARARSALFHAVADRLAKMVDAGNLSVTVHDGRMVIRLPDDILFDSGKTELKPRGKEALRAVAAAIAPLADKHHFQVAGHTDDVPIHRPQFPSNWELSSARALVVTHDLIHEGVPAPALSAAGYADVDPVAANDTTEGRQKNRRTEITLQPNIDDLVVLPSSR